MVATKNVIIKREPHPFSKRSVIYRAYFEDGIPLYIGEPSFDAIERRLKSLHPEYNIILDMGVT